MEVIARKAGYRDAEIAASIMGARRAPSPVLIPAVSSEIVLAAEKVNHPARCHVYCT